MQQRLAALLAIDPACVGLKAKTMEGLGAIGAGDAMAALAVALVVPAPALRSRAKPARPARRSGSSARPTRR
jgi:YgbB family